MGTKQINSAPDPDPTDLGHPSHKEQWLALAEAMGRARARRIFEAIHGKGKINDQPETRKIKPDT